MQPNPTPHDTVTPTRRSYSPFVLALLVMLAATGCSELAASPAGEAKWIFSEQELADARRIRPDPRNYGVRMDAEQHAAYLALTLPID